MCGCSTVSVIPVIVAAAVTLTIACQAATRHAQVTLRTVARRSSSSRIPTATASVATATAATTAAVAATIT